MNKSTGSLVSMRIQGGRKIWGSVHCPLIHVHCNETAVVHAARGQ